jgi:hypothetical protein
MNKRTEGGVGAEDAVTNQMVVDILRRQASAGIVSTVWPAVTSDLRLNLERQAVDNRTWMYLNLICVTTVTAAGDAVLRTSPTRDVVVGARWEVATLRGASAPNVIKPVTVRTMTCLIMRMTRRMGQTPVTMTSGTHFLALLLQAFFKL